VSVTQADVALVAGVSRKTVSNVINGYPHISPDVLKRVEAAVAQLGYLPSHAARSLRLGRTRVIQLVIPELDVSYFAELAGWVVHYAEEQGLSVVITQTLGDLEREVAAIGGQFAEYAEGTIFSPVGTDAATITERRSGTPIVLVGERRGDGVLDHVGIDNVAAARVATEHLIQQGRGTIGFIGAQEQNHLIMADLRKTGYLQALDRAGIVARPELSRETVAYHRTDGENAMRELLSLEPNIDAVFCATDLLALGAIRAAYDLGVRIPEDVAVVGFDDLEEGRFSVPSLTTISPDKPLIARQAVARLAARLDGVTEVDSIELDVPFRLIARESTIGR
jgi:LacI family repressor for deo operon, udp, cdd, tsx, nupC, and nupG